MDYNISAKYDHFNNLLFNGSLPKIEFSFMRRKNLAGFVQYRLIKTDSNDPNGSFIKRKNQYHFVKVNWDEVVLKMSTFLNRTEENLDAILIHEMIHVHFLNIKEFDENHGAKFIRECKRIEIIVGFPIPTFLAENGTSTINNLSIKPYGVIVWISQKNEIIYSIVSPNYIEENKILLMSMIVLTINRFPHLYKDVFFGIVTSEHWTVKAKKGTVQRVSYDKLKRFYMTAESYNDLINNFEKIG